MSDYSALFDFIRSRFPGQSFIPLHAPVFYGNERAYVLDAIDSTYVSSVGEYVNRFERMMAEITGIAHAVAIVNGTCALHLALKLAGVAPGDEVLTQPMSFVATANAIAQCGADPVFVDVERATLGMDPDALETLLAEDAERRDGGAYSRASGKRYAACVPMHTFGLPCRIERIAAICAQYSIPLVEDAAEALGSTSSGRSAGSFGQLGVFSFNGNKVATCGGGGAILTNDEALAKRAKHLSTTAKVPHPYLFDHTDVAYNYRMPNLNAALACAQLEQLPEFLANKRALAAAYAAFCQENGIAYVAEPQGTSANFWLNAIVTDGLEARDALLVAANGAGIQMRPAWGLLHRQPMYRHCRKGPLDTAVFLADRLVNLPSSVVPPSPQRA